MYVPMVLSGAALDFWLKKSSKLLKKDEWVDKDSAYRLFLELLYFWSKKVFCINYSLLPVDYRLCLFLYLYFPFFEWKQYNMTSVMYSFHVRRFYSFQLILLTWNSWVLNWRKLNEFCKPAGCKLKLTEILIWSKYCVPIEFIFADAVFFN